MSILFTIIHVLVCFMLIAVILLQAGRGSGLAGASFGGGNVQSLFGTKGSEFLQKATTIAAILFMVTSLSLSLLQAQKSRSLLESGRQRAPMDIDQIKKALEEVKGEADAKAEKAMAEGEDGVSAIKDAVGEVKGEAAQAKETAAEMAEDVNDDASGAADALKETAQSQQNS